MKITEKLALDAFKNDKETHISLDQKICHTCKERFCIYACPANLYSLDETPSPTVFLGLFRKSFRGRQYALIRHIGPFQGSPHQDHENKMLLPQAVPPEEER